MSVDLRLARAMKPHRSGMIADQGVIRESDPRIVWELGAEGWWIVIDGVPFDKHPDGFKSAAARLSLANVIAVVEAMRQTEMGAVR